MRTHVVRMGGDPADNGATTMQATINFRALNALCLAASTEETRYYLNGVKLEIDPDETRYIVTDGHRLVAHREVLGADYERNTLLGEFIIPMATCKALKLKASSGSMGCLTQIDGRLLFQHAHLGEHVCKPIDGSFPDWRRVVPRSVDGKLAHFNPSYLVDFDKIAALLNGARSDRDRTELAHNGQGPALVTFPGALAETTFGVIMPLRAAPSMFAPSWVHTPREVTQAVAA
jgi:DNA polymerase-3 subunit beta